MFLVVWTEKHEGAKGPVYEDHWIAHESYVEATEDYDRLVGLEETYTASICGVIESTEYEGLESDD